MTPEFTQPVSMPLSEHVSKTVKDYFNNLGKEDKPNLYKHILDEVEIPLLENVMTYTKNNQVKAAKILGLSRGTLRKKLKIHFDEQYCGTRE